MRLPVAVGLAHPAHVAAVDGKPGRHVGLAQLHGVEFRHSRAPQGHVAREAQPVRIVAEIDRGRRAVLRFGAQPRRAGPPRALRPLGDQVDDPARARGLELGRRVGHHLDAVDPVRRHGLQRLAQALAPELRRGPPIDEDGDAAFALQAGIAPRIDLDGRDVAQHVGDAAGRGARVVGDRIASAVDGGLHLGPRSLDHHPADGRVAGWRHRRRIGGGQRQSGPQGGGYVASPLREAPAAVADAPKNLWLVPMDPQD